MIEFDWVGVVAKYGITIFLSVISSWGLFRYLGRRWIELQFSKSLESYKHAKTREIEQLRGEVNALLDRTTKLHAQEFEVLPQVWDKLSESFAKIRLVCSRFKTYPDITWLDAAELNAIVSRSDLEDHEKRKICASDKGADRQNIFAKMVDVANLKSADRSQVDFRNYLITKGIFIQPTLKNKFKEISELMYGAISERSFDMMNPEIGALNRWDHSEKLLSRGSELLQEIEREVQERLWERNLVSDYLE